MIPRYDIIFDGALGYIERSNALYASGEFAEATSLFMMGLKMLRNNHDVETLMRRHGMRRGGHT